MSNVIDEKDSGTSWPQREHVQKKHVKICLQCAKKFFTVDKKKIYCSNECVKKKKKFPRRKKCKYSIPCEFKYTRKEINYCSFEGKCVVL